MSACSRSRCSWCATAPATLLVNEIAPRVHNSGHWTIDGCSVSQFEQHIRAVAGWPLAEPVLLRPRRDDQPDRRRGRGLSPVARDARRLRAPLRQAGDPPRPQDGPRDPRVSARLTGTSRTYAHRRSTAPRPIYTGAAPYRMPAEWEEASCRTSSIKPPTAAGFCSSSPPAPRSPTPTRSPLPRRCCRSRSCPIRWCGRRSIPRTSSSRRRRRSTCSTSSR